MSAVHENTLSRSMSPPSSPSFCTLVHNAAEKHGNRDGEPRLPKSTIFHWLKRLDLWGGSAEDFRRKYADRLCMEGWRKAIAKQQSWRMLEDAIYVSERGDRIKVAQLKGELEGLRAYADGDHYPESPNDSELAEALAETKAVFGDFLAYRKNLRTTIVHHFRKLGIWTEAAFFWMVSERQGLIDGESPVAAMESAWEFLAVALFKGVISEDGIQAIRDHLALAKEPPWFDMKFHGTCVPLSHISVSQPVPASDDGDAEGELTDD